MILIAGGTGYLGSALLDRLSKFSEDVRIIDSMRRERYCTLFNADKPFEFYEGDIRNTDDIEACLKDVETVFCLADLTNAGKSFEREEETREINYQGVKQLFEAAKDHGVKNFIYTSSASVYGNTNGLEDEEFDCEPISPYGKEKLKVETYILGNCDEINATALRLGTVYGYSRGMRFDTVINYFTFRAVQSRPLTVHKSALEEWRPYIHVDDVVDAYLFSKKNIEAMNGEAFNVVGQNMRMENVLEQLDNVFSNLDTTYIENPTANKVSYRLKTDKIEELGFNADRSVEDGVKKVKQELDSVKTVR